MNNINNKEDCINKIDMIYDAIQILNRPQTYDELLKERAALNVIVNRQPIKFNDNTESIKLCKNIPLCSVVKAIDINSIGIKILCDMLYENTINTKHLFVFKLETNIYKCIFCYSENIDYLYYTYDLYTKIFNDVKIDLQKSNIIFKNNIDIEKIYNTISSLNIFIPDTIKMEYILLENQTTNNHYDIYNNINEYCIFNDNDFDNLHKYKYIYDELILQLRNTNTLINMINKILTNKFENVCLNNMIQTIINHEYIDEYSIDHVVLYNLYFNKLFIYKQYIPQHLNELNDFIVIKILTQDEFELLTNYYSNNFAEYNGSEDITVITNFVNKCIIDANTIAKDDKIITIIRTCYYISDDITKKIKATDIHTELIKYIPDLSLVKLSELLRKIGLQKKRYNNGIYWYGMISNHKAMNELQQILLK